MNKKQLEIMTCGKGFIAALDQSGGSTPKALKAYGIDESEYNGTEEMFKKVHEMRSRIITSPNFTNDRILGVILFQQTMDSTIEGMFTGDYLWNIKGIVPFLKIDQGLADKTNGVQLMKDIDGLDHILEEANHKNMFGTKMRSLILEYNEQGIHDILKQQFDLAKKILSYDLVPIIEPEVDIHAQDKAAIETKLKKGMLELLDSLDEGQKVIFKLSPPEEANFYQELVLDPRVIRVVFLSGGHSRDKANELLANNKGVIASFSRAFSQGLRADQTKAEFDEVLGENAKCIYEASIL